MIVSINGKVTSGMSQFAFDVELEMSESTLLLTVARYKYRSQLEDRMVQDETCLHQMLEDESKDQLALGWVDLTQDNLQVSSSLDSFIDIDSNGEESGQVSPEVSKHGESFLEKSPADEQSTIPSMQASDESSQMMVSPEAGKTTAASDVPLQDSTTPLHSNRSSDRKVATETNDESSTQEEGEKYELLDSATPESGWSDDGNAWLGCICGVVHKKSKVFWIQCGGCQTWYDVAVRCVGFSQEDAEDKDWLCPACAPSQD